MVEAKAKKRSILAEKVSGDNIYKALIFFEKTNDKMNDAERRDFFSQIIEKVEIHEEEQPNGQWLKSITFKLPIIPHDMEISLDKGSHVETVVLLSKGDVDKDNFRKVKVDFSLEDMDLTELRGKATYAQVKEYILNEFGLKVSSLYIAQVKKKCGIETGENHNLPKSEDARQPQVTPEKEEAIMKAFKHFGVI